MTRKEEEMATTINALEKIYADLQEDFAWIEENRRREDRDYDLLRNDALNRLLAVLYELRFPKSFCDNVSPDQAQETMGNLKQAVSKASSATVQEVTNRLRNCAAFDNEHLGFRQRVLAQRLEDFVPLVALPSAAVETPPSAESDRSGEAQAAPLHSRKLKFLSHSTQRIWDYVLKRRSEGKLAFPKYDDIVNDLNVGRQTIRKAKSELSANGLMEEPTRKPKKPK
jgi:hypothetical protein